jgi:hypothetical protein
MIIILNISDGIEPTSTSEGNHHLQMAKKILTNTTESFLAFTAAKLALASVLESNNLRIIPALSGLFILGWVQPISINSNMTSVFSRFSFDATINHPSRTFGYTINAVTTLTAYGLFLYKLFSSGLHANLLPFSLR